MQQAELLIVYKNIYSYVLNRNDFDLCIRRDKVERERFPLLF